MVAFYNESTAGHNQNEWSDNTR